MTNGTKLLKLLVASTLPSLWIFSVASFAAAESESPEELFSVENSSFCTSSEETTSTMSAPKGGMAGFQFFTRQASLNVFDKVLAYSTPIGPSIEFRLSYNYLDSVHPKKSKLAHFGAGWTLNWVAYLDTDSAGNVTVSVPGGGTEHYPINKNRSDSLFKNNLVSHAHLIALPDGGFERHLPDGSVEVYDLDGENGRTYLTKIRSAAGNVVKLVYDKSFRTIAVTDAIGQISKIRYVSDVNSNAGFFKISEIEDPFGRKAKFTYDKTLDRLDSSIDPLGLVSKYSYAEGSNQISKLTTPYGETEFLQYRPNGSPEGSLGLRINYPDGTKSVAEHWTGNHHATYQWNKLAMQLYPLDPENHVYSHCKVTKWLTRPSGEEISVKASVKEPLESEIIYSYPGHSVKGFVGDSNLPSSISRRVAVKNADGSAGNAIQTNYFQYNRFGLLTRKEDPLRRATVYQYAPNGVDLLEIRQLTKSGQSQLLAKFEYNKNHLPIVAVDKAGNKLTFEYNKFGEMVRMTDSSNGTVTSTYDDKGFLLAVNGPSGVNNTLAKYSYDNVGRIRTATDQDGHTITLDYDDADRPVKKTFEDGSSELTKYDRLDAVWFQDRSGKITKRAYDSQNRMISITDAIGRKSQYEWCLCGALRKLIDPAGNATEWHHDIQGRIIQKKYANSSEIRFEFEKDGHRVASRIDAMKQKTNYSYNIDDTVAEISYENAVNPMSTLKYVYLEDAPAIKSATNSFGSIRYDYFPIENGKGSSGLLRSISNTAIPDSTISYDYDSKSRIKQISIGANNSVSRKYDELDRVLSETNALGTFSYEYGSGDVANRIVNIKYPNGVSTKFSYDGKAGEHRLKTITSATPNSIISQFDYTYDKAGQISKWEESIDGKPGLKYALNYDAAGQLTDAVSQSSDPAQTRNYHYEYDLASNLTMQKDRLSVTQSKFNSMNELTNLNSSAGEQSTNSDSRALSYDANGNLLSDGDTHYKWDAENRLIHIENKKEGQSSSFEYDALGRRSKIIEADSKQSTAKYLLWCDGKISEERNADGSTKKQLFALGSLIDGKAIFLSRDHLGSTRATTDASGNLVSRLEYDPLGVPKLVQGSELPDFQYAGYYAHQPSGLDLTMYRAYDSKLGRWLSRDPLGEFGAEGAPEWPTRNAKEEINSLNLYAYVGNNAIKFSDPLGLQSNSGVDFGFSRDRSAGGAGYGGGTADAGQAQAGFGGGGSWSQHSDQMQSGGTVQGGSYQGGSNSSDIVGQLPGQVRLNDPQQQQQQQQSTGSWKDGIIQAQIRAYEQAHKDWEANPFHFLIPEPQAPMCMRKK